MSNIKVYYSQPSSLGDDFWKREFLHELDLMTNEMKQEAVKIDDLLSQKTSASVASTFSHQAIRHQQAAGRAVLQERETEERKTREEQQKYEGSIVSIGSRSKVSLFQMTYWPSRIFLRRRFSVIIV